MPEFIDTLLHVDQLLAQVAENYGPWVYGLLFAVVFAETGFVVTPFLPGDSLLFAVGALSATGALKLHIAAPLLLIAAILGNTCNYHIGKAIGPKLFRGEGTGLISRLLSRKHLKRAHDFFERHGGKAVMLGQFVPVVRTFCPFIAGAGAMTYSKFIFFNITGAIVWITVCCGAGLAFGQMKIVKENFSVAMLCVVALSLIPVAVEFIRARRSRTLPSAPSSNPVQGSQP